MTDLLWWLLQCSIVAALAIPIISAASWFFRRRPAVQHALWAVVLLKFLTPSIIVWPWPVLDVLDSASYLAPDLNDTAIRMDLAAKAQTPTFNEASWIMPGWITSGEASRIVAFISTVLFIVWLVGGVIFAARQFLRIRNQSRLLKRGSVTAPELATVVQHVAGRLGLRPPKTLKVRDISSPAVWCLGKPALLWPEGRPHEGTTSVTRSLIAHELAHLLRRDHWMAWIQLVASIIWWWNPLFWLVHRKLTSTAELACDAVALEAYPQDRCAYAESLLTFAATQAFPALALGIRSGAASSLERRMHFVVSERFDGKLSPSGVVLSALIAIAVAPSWSFNEAHGGMLNRAASPAQTIPAPDGVDMTAAQESRVLAIRKEMQRQARQRLLDSDLAVERAKKAHASANSRVDALEQLNEDELRKSELEEAFRILELTASELEYAEAFRDLAEKQMNAVR
jgi:beta-lactamase regulating signal transducer with metallopeptidase domain